MKYVIFILAVCCAACGQQNINSSPQENLIDSTRYMANALDFIKTVKAKELADTSFILSDQVFGFERFDCLRSIERDTVNFSKEEIAWINQKKYPTYTHWSNAQFSNIRFVNGDTVTAIFKRGGPVKGWNEFYARYGKSFHRYSMPIFLKNDTEVLFYDESSCGGLCGTGHLSLYRKENNNWVEVKKYCNWIS